MAQKGRLAGRPRPRSDSSSFRSWASPGALPATLSPINPGIRCAFGNALPRKYPSWAFMRSSLSAGKALNTEVSVLRRPAEWSSARSSTAAAKLPTEAHVCAPSCWNVWKYSVSVTSNANMTPGVSTPPSPLLSSVANHSAVSGLEVTSSSRVGTPVMLKDREKMEVSCGGPEVAPKAPTASLVEDAQFLRPHGGLVDARSPAQREVDRATDDELQDASL